MKEKIDRFLFFFCFFNMGGVLSPSRRRRNLQASMAKYRPLFPFNLILGYVSVVWTQYMCWLIVSSSTQHIFFFMLILWCLWFLGSDSIYMLMWWEVHCGLSSVQTVVIGDACSCAAGYPENYVPFKFCWSPSHNAKTNPLPAGCKSSASVQFIS